jgi:phospholipase/carboxylesterase
MNSEPWNIFDDPFLFRVYPPKNSGSFSIFILIHGWTGNENSMSVFHQAATGNAFCILPRGSINIGQEKYGWVDIRKNQINKFSDFQANSEKLYNSIKSIIKIYQPDSNTKINLIGFSQGSAVCLTLALEFPETFEKVALLSGFLPEDPPIYENKSFNKLNFYIAHGTLDKMVDYKNAIKTYEYLSTLGATVQLCSEDVGHKIGAKCILNLKKFFQTSARLEE